MNMINFIDVVCFGEVRLFVRCFIGYGGYGLVYRCFLMIVLIKCLLDFEIVVFLMWVNVFLS